MSMGDGISTASIGWAVIGVLAIIIPLAIAIIKPILNLTKQLTVSAEAVKTLTLELDKLTSKNSEAHLKIWEQLTDHDDQLGNHEGRIIKLETKNEITSVGRHSDG
jgi:predicted PurR-regulated permease PerM